MLTFFLTIGLNKATTTFGFLKLYEARKKYLSLEKYLQKSQDFQLGNTANNLDYLFDGLYDT